MAFRYVVPQQPSFTNVRITGERTQFRYSKDATLYPLVVNGFQSSYEDDYQMRTVSGLHKDWLVALPLLAEVPGNGWVAITEANIDNYAGMYLRSDKPLFSLKAELSPNVNVPGVAVDTKAPFKSPWRVLMIGDTPGRLIESNIILNLNPPSQDCRHLLDPRGQIRLGLVVGPRGHRGQFHPGHEHRDHEALH